MYFMEGLPQSIQFNPSVNPNLRFFLELPGISGNSMNLFNSGFNYREIDNFMDNLDNPNYNPDEFVNSIGDYNTFISEFRTNILTAGVKLSDKEFLSFGIDMNSVFTLKAASNIAYTLVDYDNLSPEHFPIVVNDVSTHSNNYVSMGVTYSRQITDRLTVGISPRLNLNMMGIKSNNINYIVEIDEEGTYYNPMTDEYEYEFNTRVEGEVLLGLPTPLNEEVINNDDVDLGDAFPDGWEDNYGISDLFQNKTMSVDLGATYDFENWTFSASILNIGASKWKKNAYLLEGDNDNMRITHQKKINYAIPAKLWLGAKNQFSNKWSYGIAVNSTFFKTQAKSLAILSLNGTISKFLSTSVSYTIGYKSNNIGLGLRARFLPGTDIYFITDNILQTFNYKKAYKMSAAFGINISIWEKKDNLELEEVGSI